jgi:hypothetical protein
MCFEEEIRSEIPYKCTLVHPLGSLFYPEDVNSKFLRNLVPFYQRTWRHIPRENKFPVEFYLLGYNAV